MRPELARAPKQAAHGSYTCCVPAGRHEDGAESGDTDEDETAEAPGLLCLWCTCWEKCVHGRLSADLVAAGGATWGSGPAE